MPAADRACQPNSPDMTICSSRHACADRGAAGCQAGSPLQSARRLAAQRSTVRGPAREALNWRIMQSTRKAAHEGPRAQHCVSPANRMGITITDLSDNEIRVLGCLLEKQRTTPDAYPLSLNALRLACNQSTNRDPVLDYDESTIRDALHRLERRGLVRLASGAGSRSAKYRHLLADALPMDPGEQ